MIKFYFELLCYYTSTIIIMMVQDGNVLHNLKKCQFFPLFNSCVVEKLSKTNDALCRLQAVSLFSWSVQQNARDTQMTTRVSEGAIRERHHKRDPFFSGCRPCFSRLASLPLNASARVHSPY